MKLKKITTILVLILLGSLVGVLSAITSNFSRPQATSSNYVAPAYQYAEVKTRNGVADFSDMLDEGWQLTGITMKEEEITFYFRKR